MTGPDEPAVDDATPSEERSEVGDDALAALRTELEAVDELPLSQRVELFERANTTLAAEPAALDEV
ncbi:MAG: hypothetical protein ACOCT8_00220 [Actinomycetota bacterium]